MEILKSTGPTQAEEMGTIEAPIILLTNTNNVEQQQPKIRFIPTPKVRIDSDRLLCD